MLNTVCRPLFTSQYNLAVAAEPPVPINIVKPERIWRESTGFANALKELDEQMFTRQSILACE